MREPAFTALLTACLLSTAGVAVAQQSDQPKLNVQKTDDNRAVITVDKPQQSQQLSSTTRNEQRNLRGTVVSLETYLKQGEQAARDEASRSANRPGAPKAILAEDGQVYVVLGMNQAAARAAMDDKHSHGHSADASATGMHSDSDARLEVSEGKSSSTKISTDTDTSSASATATTGSMEAGSTVGQPAGADDDTLAADPDPEDPHKLRSSPGYELSTGDDQDSDKTAKATTKIDRDTTTVARADVDVDKDADVDVDMNPDSNRNDLNAPGRERHTHKADLSARDERLVGSDDADLTVRSDSDMKTDIRSSDTVYGFADPSHEQLRVGDKVNVTGQVYERGGLRAIEISNIAPRQS